MQFGLVFMSNRLKRMFGCFIEQEDVLCSDVEMLGQSV